MTFTKTFTIRRPTIKQRISSFLSPREFLIYDKAVTASLPNHLHKAAAALTESLKQFRINKDEMTMYYPGCGQDMIWPMIALQGVAPDSLKWTIIGQDTSDTLGALISTMQTITGQTAFSMINKSNDGTTQGARFRFKGKTVEIVSSNSDALAGSPGIISRGYDIYFERGFDLMRSQRPGFLDEALSALRTGGLAITDAGFPETTKNISKSNTKLPAWGFYKSPAVYVKTARI